MQFPPPTFLQGCNFKDNVQNNVFKLNKIAVKRALGTVILILILAHQPLQCCARSSSRKMPKRQFGKINRCLRSSNEVGCDTFACLHESDRCDVTGLTSLCKKFTREAGNFNQMGKSFIKASVKCMTLEIKSKFRTVKRNCPHIESFLNRVQNSCYTSSNVCEIAAKNNASLKRIMPATEILSSRTSLNLFQAIVGCDDEVKSHYNDVIANILGRSFLNTLNYLQTGTSSHFTNAFWGMLNMPLFAEEYNGENS